MAEYRTPEERQAMAEQDARVTRVLDQAVRDGASLIVAMDLGEPEDVVEHWIDRLWDGLEDGLSDNHPERPGLTLKPPRDRLRAITLLLKDRMEEEARKILRSVREVEL